MLQVKNSQYRIKYYPHLLINYFCLFPSGSAPNLASNNGYPTKTNAPPPTVVSEKSKSSKGFRKIFGKMRRSSSGNLQDEKRYFNFYYLNAKLKINFFSNSIHHFWSWNKLSSRVYAKKNHSSMCQRDSE